VNCEQIRNRLNAYVDQEVTARESTEIALHLKSCANCRNEVESLHQLAFELRQHPIPSPSEALTTRIVAQGTQRLHAAKRRSLRWSLPHSLFWDSLPGSMRAAAAVMLIIGLAAGTWLGLSVSAEPEEQPALIAASSSNPTALYNLDYFSDTPDGSLSQIYSTLSTPQTDGGK
jgi:anti-sigma factor RsiW